MDFDGKIGSKGRVDAGYKKQQLTRKQFLNKQKQEKAKRSQHKKINQSASKIASFFQRMYYILISLFLYFMLFVCLFKYC